MFESIVFGRNSFSNVENLGALAECLLFYKTVHVVVDHVGFTRLARICGPETLLGLIEDGNLSMTYLENRPAVATQNHSGRDQHSFILFTPRGKESQNLIPRVFQELTARQGRGRRLASKLLRRIRSQTYDQAAVEGSLMAIEAASHTGDLVPRLLATLGDLRVPEKIVFNAHKSDGSIVVDTNLDFDDLDMQYSQISADRRLTAALLLDMLYEGYTEINFAAALGSEMAPTPTEYVIAKERFASVFKATGESIDCRNAFFDLVIPNRMTVAKLINSGQRTFEDLRKLLGEAARFKEWLHGQDPDVNMVKAYIDRISGVSWLSGSVARNLRFIIFNAAQIAAGTAIAGTPGMLAGLGIAAADSFLLERLLTGWRPNQFVTGPLQRFLSGSAE